MGDALDEGRRTTARTSLRSCAAAEKGLYCCLENWETSWREARGAEGRSFEAIAGCGVQEKDSREADRVAGSLSGVSRCWRCG